MNWKLKTISLVFFLSISFVSYSVIKKNDFELLGDKKIQEFMEEKSIEMPNMDKVNEKVENTKHNKIKGLGW